MKLDQSRVTFIGVDLAWRSDRNPSGAAVLIGNRSGAELKDIAEPLRSNVEVLSYIRRYSAGPTVIAIDAPLLIGNASGQRSCETEVGVRYGARDASCHTSNLRLYPNAASVQLANELLADGFSHAPSMESPRTILEVYPHAAMVAIFDLPRIIKYKKGSVSQKCAGLREVQKLISNLSTLTPPLTKSPELDLFLGEDVSAIRGGVRKNYEDSLDAVFCAYLAFFYWYWGKERTEVFGDTKSGYIVNPKCRLARKS